MYYQKVYYLFERSDSSEALLGFSRYQPCTGRILTETVEVPIEGWEWISCLAPRNIVGGGVFVGLLTTDTSRLLVNSEAPISMPRKRMNET